MKLNCLSQFCNFGRMSRSSNTVLGIEDMKEKKIGVPPSNKKNPFDNVAKNAVIEIQSSKQKTVKRLSFKLVKPPSTSFMSSAGCQHTCLISLRKDVSNRI